MKQKIFMLLLILGFNIQAQNWQKSKEKINTNNNFIKFIPVKYNSYNYNLNQDLNNLLSAPYRTEGLTSDIHFKIPVDLNNKVEDFIIYKTEYLQEKLQQKYPNIRTFVGISTTSAKKIYFNISKYDCRFTVLRPGLSSFIVKKTDNNNHWISYNSKDEFSTRSDFQCDSNTQTAKNNYLRQTINYSDGILRKYRYAPAVTGEYSQYTLTRLNIPSTATDAEKKTAILGAITETVTRINSVYETDLAVSLMLVNNEENNIYLDASTDPYDNGTTDMSTLLFSNQAAVNSNIGNSNYDVSQVWCQGNLQGLARLSAVCDNNNKAKGAARGENVETDRFIISVASHELGHLFGAHHTFANSTCGGSRNDQTAVETGSGTTIMSYAGICPPDIQNWTDDRFNIVAIDEITSGFSSGVGSCAQQITLNNQKPIIDPLQNKYIPKNTPFYLDANASDPEGEPITYIWDEVDTPTDPISTPPNTNWNSGPMFRPYPASTNSRRYFPNIDTLLTNHTSWKWEVLPSVSRFLRFKLTVKDNHQGGGQLETKSIAISVRDDAGPFVVTSDQSITSWQPGDTKTITWDVAGTTNYPISCNTVDILLSLDRGYHYTEVLASDIPNNGSYQITVPNVNSPSARYMVKGHNNYFFSLNKGEIQIGNYVTQCDTYNNTTPLIITDNDTDGVESIINVPDNFDLTKVTVHVNISHTYIQDINAKLVSPDGTEVILFNNSCGNNDNLIMTFDDDSPAIVCNDVGADLSFHPYGNLSDYIHKNSLGDWKLKLSDDHVGDEGTLNSWSITLCRQVLDKIIETSINNIKIYPNPVNNEINISFNTTSEIQQIKIFDINSRLLFEKNYKQKGNFKTKINTSELSNGTYFVKINDGNKNLISKFIKK